jgi:hypothetical protein
MSEPTPPTHETLNRRGCDEALERRGSLAIWLDPATAWGG